MGNQELLELVIGALKVVKGPDERGEYTAWCPFHPDGNGKAPHHPNLNVSIRGYMCHACGENGGLPSLVRHLGVELADTSTAPDARYGYRDEDQVLLFEVVRRRGKRFSQRRPDGRGGWEWNLRDTRRVPYRLPELLGSADATVFITEGEKDADRLAKAGLVATTNPGGAGKWREEYSAYLRDRDVVVLPDNDGPGRQHARAVARSLEEYARTIKVVDLPGLDEKGDVSDWLEAEHTVAELQQIIDEAPIWVPGDDAENAAPDTGTDDAPIANQLVKHAVDSGITFFHDERGEPYVVLSGADGRRILALGSRDLGRWLSRFAWEKMGRALGRETRSSALQVLEGIARYDGLMHPLHVRCAWQDDEIWVDLDGQRAVRVTGTGWEIIDDPPILFRSFPHQRPLPDPVHGGDPKRVLEFLNTTDRETQLLVLAYLVVMLVPDIPVAALVLVGVQGSAKTTFLKVLKRLVDPSAVEVRGGVKDLGEYAQAAFQNRILFFDNLTTLPGWLSDGLCRTVTGEGWSKRALYTDEDTMVFEFQRVVGLAGINLVAERADLLDRSLIISLGPVSPGQRRDERAFWTTFEQLRGQILGGILDALAKAVAIERKLQVDRLPRLADFARWGEAAARALGYQAGDFLTAYAKNVDRQNEAAVDASPVAQAVLAFLEGKPGWEGTPARLLEELGRLAAGLHIDTRARAWPKNPTWMTRRLREVQPNLAAMGVELAERRDGSKRTLALRRVRGPNVTDVTDDKPVPEHHVTSDATMMPMTLGVNGVTSQIVEGQRDGTAGTSDAISGPSAHAVDEEVIEERAAILEFDGGLDRAEAERVAREGA